MLDWLVEHPDSLWCISEYLREPDATDESIAEVLTQAEEHESVLRELGGISLETLRRLAASPVAKLHVPPSCSVDKAGPAIELLLGRIEAIGGGVLDSGRPLEGTSDSVAPRLLAPPQVLALAQVTGSLDSDSAEERLDRDRLREIEPRLRWDDEDIEYVLDHYEDLRSYLAEAAAARDFILVRTSL
jgi:hypothetical protein